MDTIGRLFEDVRRRRVLPSVALYIVGAWVTIQVADLAIEAGILPWTLRDVFVAAFIGFPIALFVSWFYDITRRGVIRTPPLGVEHLDRSLRSRDYALLASLATLWAGAVWWAHVPAALDRSIAVLPFENRGHDPEGADLAFGVRLDLQTQLEKLNDIKVIAQPTMELIDARLPIRELADKLGVAFVMKGTVERVLNRVRVSVTLIDGERDVQTWSGSYDRELSTASLFDIRDDIAAQVTRTLQVVLGPEDAERIRSRPTANLAAYQAYLLGKQRMAKRTIGGFVDALDYFHRAIELDPGFALAHVGLADAHYLGARYGTFPQDEMRRNVQAAIERALELDEQLGEAYATLGAIQDDPAAAAAALERALELNPSYATAHQWYGATLVRLGRTEEGLAEKRRALELDPLSPIINHDIGLTLARLGRFDEALAQQLMVIEIEPDLPGAYERIGDLHATAFGRLDEAVIWQRRAIARDPRDAFAPFVLGLIYLNLGDVDQAERWFQRARRLEASGSALADAAFEPLYLRRGEEAKALEVARETLRNQPTATQTLAHLRNHAVRAGDVEEARGLYERAFPELFEANTTIGRDNYEAAIDLAAVLMRTRQHAHAERLLEQALRVVDTLPRLGPNGHGVADARIHALRGHTTAALAALRQAIDEGWRNDWWFYLQHDLNLDSLRGEPEFLAMAAEVEADMAQQLARVRAWDANGELASVPPLPG